MKIRAELVQPKDIRLDMPEGLRVIALEDVASYIHGPVYKGAMEELDRLPPSKQSDAMVSVLNQLNRLVMPYSRLAQSISNKMISLVSKGQALEKAGDIDRAIVYYEQAVAAGWYASLAYERLRIIYKKQGRLDQAVRICNTYLVTLDRLSLLRPGHPNIRQRAKWQSWIEKLSK